MIYLIALNHRQAEYYAKDMGLKKNDFRVITEPIQMRGLGSENIFLRVGEWYKIKEEYLDEIHHYLEFIKHPKTSN